MKSFLCTVLVEVPEKVYKEFSERADLLFHSDVGRLHNEETTFLVSYKQIENNVIPKYLCFTEEGGV